MKHEDRKINYFFCIGCQKSGTTILARLLDQHPDIACLWEAYFLNPGNNSSILNADSDAYQKHGFSVDQIQNWYDRVKYSNPFSLMSRATHKLSGKYNFNFDPYRDVISDALEDFASRCNAKVAGDKWPWYIDFIDQMLRAFPNAKYIYTVRDPRGIWNSAQKFKDRKRGDEILREMLDKDKIITPYLSKENFYTIKYEDLIVNSQESCQKLYNFLGCDYNCNYLTYKREVDVYPDRWDWVPEAKGELDVSITTKWKTQMSPDQVRNIERISHWFIEKYNYN